MFMIAQVSKRRLHRAQPAAVDHSPTKAVDLLLHLFKHRLWSLFFFRMKEHDLPGCLLPGILQTFFPEVAGLAGRFRRGKLDPGSVVYAYICPIAVQPFACRAGAGELIRVVAEVPGPEPLGQRLGRLVLFGMCKARIAFSEEIVGNVGITTFLFQPFQVGTGVEAGISGQSDLTEDIGG